MRFSQAQPNRYEIYLSVKILQQRPPHTYLMIFLFTKNGQGRNILSPCNSTARDYVIY